MNRLRILLGAAVVLSFVVPAAGAFACPTRGGGEASFEPDQSPVVTLLVAAKEADQQAMAAESRAKSERMEAKRQRRLAADLRSQAMMNADMDGSLLEAKAVVADKEAMAAETRASNQAKRARALRAKATELRAQAEQLLDSDSRSI